uniref:Uncharacterized protein n=1 Tax=Arundo donax TaxID=35708 RepID=A0A0A8ZX42_ARUDO
MWISKKKNCRPYDIHPSLMNRLCASTTTIRLARQPYDIICPISL